MLQKLVGQLEQDTEVAISLADVRSRTLCSPFWIEQRENLPTQQAFEKLVQGPFMKKVTEGNFQPGDHVEVIRNIDQIDFKKHEGDNE